MFSGLRSFLSRLYEELLKREIEEGPTHIAVIQDGNRRYARERGAAASDGHRAGAKTTERVLSWCEELDVEELTLYAFSTENFRRPKHEREYLYDLLCEKLTEFADSDQVHKKSVKIRILGEQDLLPDRVQEAAKYATKRTEDNGRFILNIALAYGGRAELLGAARDVVAAVRSGEITPDEIDAEEIENRLYNAEVRDVDLIIRTGGDERTSNFLPWHANGNEAAVFFCTPYWPEFSKIDFLRAIRTYEYREKSWQRTRRKRAMTLISAVSDVDLPTARNVIARGSTKESEEVYPGRGNGDDTHDLEESTRDMIEVR